MEIRSGVPHDTPESSHLPARPLHLEFDFLDYVLYPWYMVGILYPGWGPVGPPVARSAANPWAPGFENLKQMGLALPGLGPQPRGFGRNLSPAKASASPAKPDPAELVVDSCFGLENLKGTSPARAWPTAVGVLPKLVSSKSLSLASAAKVQMRKSVSGAFWTESVWGIQSLCIVRSIQSLCTGGGIQSLSIGGSAQSYCTVRS